MDFGALPPEINSTRMYAGAGAAPLMAAGATWNGLAVELSTTASSVESVIMQLTTEQWLGPASMSMVVAAQPYLAWLTYTAESAAHAAAQAMASAAAFEAAFAMTVPPAEVAANRALLAALVATNVLGQNTPAIMATEAHYGEMWAQDALAMYGYAASSAAAGRLNPLITPSQTANMAGLAGQAAAVSHAAAASTVQQVGLGSLISNLPNAVMGFASPLTSAADAAGLGGIIQDIEELLGITFVQNAINGAVNTTAWFVMATIPNAVFLGHAFAALNPATVTAAADAVPAAAAAAGLAHTVTPVGVGGASLTASLGEASSVGGLSVPAGWSTAAPAMTSGTTALEGSGWAVPEEAGPVAAMPGMAGISGAAKGAGAYAGPRYGFKPIVMPKTGRRLIGLWPIDRAGRLCPAQRPARRGRCGNRRWGRNRRRPDRQSSRRSHGVAAAPAGLASGEMVGYEGARGRAGREMSESATAGARSSRIPFGIIRNHEAVRPRRSRHLNHARDTPQMVAVAQVWREVVQATAIAIAPPLPVVSWGLISLAFLSHTVRGRYRRSPPAESGHHSNRRQAK